VSWGGLSMLASVVLRFGFPSILLYLRQLFYLPKHHLPIRLEHILEYRHIIHSILRIMPPNQQRLLNHGIHPVLQLLKVHLLQPWHNLRRLFRQVERMATLRTHNLRVLHVPREALTDAAGTRGVVDCAEGLLVLRWAAADAGEH
jgi:hypothetical protein